MRAPRFWQSGGASWPCLLLAPVGALYDAVTRWRFARVASVKAPIPVICVGNLTAGGSGKTPAALAIAAMLRAKGYRPAFLSRGYGGSEAGPLLVDPSCHSAAKVGDEPLLLAANGPAIVSRDRVAGLGEALRIGADAVVMDDGLQNPSLAKTVGLAIVDGEAGIGNGRVIPAGPLRARLDFQFSLADAVIVVGSGEAGEDVAARARARGIPVFAARLDGAADHGLAGRKLVAFAGIGRPEKFFASLAATGAEVVARRSFGDHHVYSERDCAGLLALARQTGAELMTTTKDLARLGAGTAPSQRAVADKTKTLPVELRFKDGGEFERFVLARLAMPAAGNASQSAPAPDAVSR
ncbi:MAG: tetraacyldisaccharide 4'-kinase [Rhodobiaceae bacterium]|nr:tetraacyldisaccharide 4'-kinase [Rhodobiaceae bacterium]